MKSKSLTKRTVKDPVKAEPLARFAAWPRALKRRLAFPKAFKAAVVVDSHGSPRYFAFDTSSLWDVLCAVDAAFEEQASDKAYVLDNPVGWLIDAIEAHLPLNPKIVLKLKQDLEDTQRLGTVPLEVIKQRLGLA